MKSEELDQRTLDVLRSLVEEYLQSGDPVGSRTLSKSPGVALSPATIRNIMADLEEGGLLAQPHTSSGRVPTDRGLRWYVDHLQKQTRLPSHDEELIHESFDKAPGDLDTLLSVATQLLARLSHLAGVIITPRIDTARIAHVDFVRLAPDRILVILATAAGTVQHKVVDVKEDYSMEELSRFGQFVAQSFCGLTLREARERTLGMLSEERAEYDRLLEGAMAIAAKTFETPPTSPELHIEGTLNIFEAPEFADVGKLKGLLKALQEKEKLVKILDEVISGSGLHVIIGSESQIADLSGISVVSASYRAGEAAGALGVLGPTRMDYDRAVTVVDRIADILNRRLLEIDAPSKGDRHA